MSLRWPNEHWRRLEPVSGVDALVVRGELGGAYAPTMTATRVLLTPNQPLARYADYMVQQFSDQVGGVERIHLVESPQDALAPGLSQLLKANVEIDGKMVDLRRLDGLLATPQSDGRLAVLALSLTCTADQLPVVGPEFGSVLTSLT